MTSRIQALGALRLTIKAEKAAGRPAAKFVNKQLIQFDSKEHDIGDILSYKQNYVIILLKHIETRWGYD